MVVYDDLEPSEKIKIYDRGIDLAADQQAVYKMLISYRTGDMLAPRLDATEALRTELEHFVRCVRSGETPLTGGASGLRIVRLLEAATTSLGHRGALVEL
jgi:predicted dehydrogenase